MKDGTLHVQNFSVNFCIITVRLGYYKFCARWVPKMFTGKHKKQRMALALTFLKRYHEDGDEFLSHIAQVTGQDCSVCLSNFVTILQILHS
jgi:hypothetical protein